MKLNLLSPLPPARSGIAVYVRELLPALRELAEVTLWTHQTEWDRDLENFTEIRTYPCTDLWRRLNSADMTVYQMGNHPGFHRWIWEISRHHPGIVVLHDVSLQPMFAEIFVQDSQDPEAYEDVMEQYHGPAGRRAATQLLTQQKTAIDLAFEYPLTQLALVQALGVMVHNETAFNDLQAYRRWPVVCSELPYAPKAAKRDGSSLEPARSADSTNRLIVFGHLGLNRRLDSVLHAIAGLGERERFRLDVFGEVWDPAHLNRLRHDLALEDIVTLHGFVTDEVLHRALDQATLAINLRFPSVGETSLSQLLIWDHALPTLVTNAGWYSALSDDMVARVHIETEIEDIQTHLVALLEDPARFAAMGQRGRLFLEEKHSPETYARALVDLASQADGFRSTAIGLTLADQVARELALWPAAPAREGVEEGVAASILELLKPPS